jgi:hypothetical protein
MDREYEWRTESVGWVKEVLNKISQKASTKHIAAFGYHKEYINVLEKRKQVLERLGYGIWLIDKEGKVCKYLTA